MTPRVLMVGLDGATFDIIHPLVAEGRLPNLAHLLRQGSWGILRSTVPPISPSAWTAVFTGKNAGKHGIYDFQELAPHSYNFRTIRTDEHREKTLWQLLGEGGKRSIVLDVPFTYPPHPLEGLMLTGYGTPRTAGTIFTYPADLDRHLPAELRAEVRVALPQHRFDRSPAFIHEWQEVMTGRRRLLNHLISHEDWDFFMVVFSITDNMAHVFWTYLDPAHPNYQRPEAAGYREAFLHSYEQCDQLLGDLLERAGPQTNTIVLSDHGFGSVRPRQYLYNRLLAGRFLQPRSAAGGVPLGSRLARLAVNTYNRFPFLREWVKGLRPGSRQSLIKTLESSGIMPTAGSIDFARSQVIPANFGLSLWVNDDGRFPQGTVPAAQLPALLDKLSDFLLADRDAATGRPIIANVYRGQDIYHGPLSDRAADLIIEYTNFYDPQQAQPTPNPHVEGGHTPDGILLAHGPQIATAPAINGATLMDLAPTVLYLLDQPIPPDMDGRPLTELIQPNHLAQHPPRPAASLARLDEGEMLPEPAGYRPEEEAEIEDQLRQLGYID